MKCLNCGHIALKKHCPNCGQKTSTHRFSLQSIFDYAVVNAYFSLNAGLLFTLKELLIRPGHAVREYLQGKRAKYLNAFSCFLVALALSLFLKSFDTTPQSEFAKYDLFEQYPRFAQMLLIPFLATTSFLIYRRVKLYFAEHLVIATYVVGMQLFLSIPFDLLEFVSDNPIFLNILGFYSIFFMGYFIYYYYQIFKRFGIKKKRYAIYVFLLFFSVGLFVVELLGTIALGLNTETFNNLFP